MFTGIVEERGSVVSFEKSANAWLLVVSVRRAARDAAIGESIAVNGCCLTLASRDSSGNLCFELLEETRRLTGFAGLKPSARVNVERSLRAGGPIGGHFVTGHIDTTGVVETLEARGKDSYLRVSFDKDFDRYVVPKGSIAIDGVSLTVAETGPGWLAVWLIPHTLAETNFGERKRSDKVNLEFDILGKHVEKILQHAKKT